MGEVKESQIFLTVGLRGSTLYFRGVISGSEMKLSIRRLQKWAEYAKFTRQRLSH